MGSPPPEWWTVLSLLCVGVLVSPSGGDQALSLGNPGHLLATQGLGLRGMEVASRCRGWGLLQEDCCCSSPSSKDGGGAGAEMAADSFASVTGAGCCDSCEGGSMNVIRLRGGMGKKKKATKSPKKEEEGREGGEGEGDVVMMQDSDDKADAKRRNKEEKKGKGTPIGGEKVHGASKEGKDGVVDKRDSVNWWGKDKSESEGEGGEEREEKEEDQGVKDGLGLRFQVSVDSMESDLDESGDEEDPRFDGYDAPKRRNEHGSEEEEEEEEEEEKGVDEESSSSSDEDGDPTPSADSMGVVESEEPDWGGREPEREELIEYIKNKKPRAHAIFEEECKRVADLQEAEEAAFEKRYAEEERIKSDLRKQGYAESKKEGGNTEGVGGVESEQKERERKERKKLIKKEKKADKKKGAVRDEVADGGVKKKKRRF